VAEGEGTSTGGRKERESSEIVINFNRIGVSFN
jgi:hypothetical protein